MAQATRHRRIEASPGEIWEVLADFGALASWAPNVNHSVVTTQTGEGPGATRRVQAGRTVLLERVVDWQPAVTLAYELDGLPGAVRHAENRWRLEPVEGGTEVSLTSTVDAGSRPPQKLVAAVVARVLARVSNQLLDGLDNRMEGIARV
ncbi:MAG TPA: SRPBCC family protein [Acidimicrobiales bacterium]|nr:SRPBCC family protein [Acidimicrobiales bacterium]